MQYSLVSNYVFAFSFIHLALQLVFLLINSISSYLYFILGGGGVAQSVEHTTPGEEIPGSIPHCGRPLPTGWVGVSV